ncbi:MAG: hypothetical protein AAF694_03545 [Bacteroidota bacterium]
MLSIIPLQVNTNPDILTSVRDSFVKVITQLIEVLPSLVIALSFLLFGWIFAKIVSGAFGKLLSKIGLDRLADRLNETDFFKESGIELRPISIIKRVIYWLLMLIFILSAAEQLGLQIVTEQIGALIEFIPRLFTSALIMAFGFYLADWIKKVVANACQSFGLPAWKFISSVVFYILLIAIGITALNQAGIDTQIITFTLFILIGGSILAFSIAYGFASRDILSSILTAYYSKYQFGVGQEIEIEGHRGVIHEITSTALTLDIGNAKVVFPMNRMLAEKVIIHTDIPEGRTMQDEAIPQNRD